MTRKRKSDHCYSERHKRRLVKQETEACISRIKQMPLENIFADSEINLGFQDVDVTSNNEDFENVLSRTEIQNSNVDHCQDSASNSLMGSGNDTDIAIESLDMETHLEAQSGPNASTKENDYPNHSDDLNDSIQSNQSSTSQKSTSSNDLSSDLCQWISKHRPPRNAVNGLLRLLRKHTKTKLPKDYRSLLKTPRSTEIHSLAGGQYWHNGLEKAVKSIVQKKKKAGHDAKNVGLMINIDGAPLGESSQYSLWPILCSEDILKEVHIVGAFVGEGKPNDSNQFLDMFITEAVGLVNNGFQIENEQFNVRIEALICDAPAKALVLQLKNYNGYSSCTKCNIEGEYLDRTMCFPATVGENVTLRTDENFKNYIYKDDYQIGRTNLCRIPRLGLITNVPLDYMHLVCLGMMKKLFLLWLRGPLKVRIPAYDQFLISCALLRLGNCLPSDFVRKPKALKFLYLWKATEYRQFLLYLGPIVLKDVLKKAPYEHFLILHAAITILVSPVMSKHPQNVDYAEELLKHFVESFGNVYEVKYISHNVHNLLHLAEDVRKFGPLDEFSAFRFENYMSTIIKLRRKGERPLQQIARRVAEYDYLSTTNTASEDVRITDGFKKRHYEGPLTADITECKQYKALRQSSCHISSNDSKNNCCMLKNGTIVECVNFVKTPKTSYVIGYELVRIENVYSSPCVSETFNIHVAEKVNDMKSWPCADICLKLMKIPLEHVTSPNNTKIAVFPVLHTSSSH